MRRQRLHLAAVVLTVAGLGIVLSVPETPAAEPVACDSCTARHQRLAQGTLQGEAP